MTFEQLLYFTEVYRQKSITSTAEMLHISRQCLSKSIKKLEEELGVTLFSRSVSGVVATAAANELYIHAQKILDEQYLLKRKMNDYTNPHDYKQQLSLGLPEILLSLREEKFVNDIETAFPDTNFNIQIAYKKEILQEHNDYDIIIFNTLTQLNKQYTKDGNYQYLYLYKIPVYIWCKKDLPLAHHSSINIFKLRDYPACILRNTFNGSDLANTLQINYKYIIDSKKVFKDKLLSGFYAVDLPIYNNHLLYEELLNDPDKFTAIKTENFLHVYIKYRSDIEEKYIAFFEKYDFYA